MRSKTAWISIILLGVIISIGIWFWKYTSDSNVHNQPPVAGKEPVTDAPAGLPMVDRTNRPPVVPEIEPAVPPVIGGLWKDQGSTTSSEQPLVKSESVPETPTAEKNRAEAVKAESATPAIVSMPEDTQANLSKQGGAQESVQDADIMSRGEPVADSGVVAGKVQRTHVLGREDRRRFSNVPIVGDVFVDDLGRFLVGCYWPQGTHPQTKNSGYLDLTPRMLNLRYGGHLTGFQVDAENGAAARKIVLRYAFTPSMLKDLAASHSVRLLDTMQRQAGELRRGNPEKLLSGFEQVEMFTMYSDLCMSVSEVINAYLSSPNMPDKVEKFRLAELKSQQAGSEFFASRHRGADPKEIQSLADAYQNTIVQRELLRDSIVSAIRRKGDTNMLDVDEVLFIVSWLDRRGTENRAAVEALGGVLKSLSKELRQKAREY